MKNLKKIENKEKISRVTFTMAICPFCPLGGDYYKAEITVQFDVEGSYPDYIEMDKAIQELGGQPLNIEQVAEAVYNIVDEFKPKSQKVSIYAESNTHFPVVVEKNSD
jgi:hypothetical protein